MLRAIARVLFWTYERGSLPYDIACGLILAFIFFTPPQIFDGSFFTDSPATESAAAEPAQESLNEMPGPQGRREGGGSLQAREGVRNQEEGDRK